MPRTPTDRERIQGYWPLRPGDPGLREGPGREGLGTFAVSEPRTGKVRGPGLAKLSSVLQTSNLNVSISRRLSRDYVVLHRTNIQSKRVHFQAFVAINDLPKAVECYDKIGECSRASVQQKVNALREAMELCNTLQVIKLYALDSFGKNSTLWIVLAILSR